MKLLNQSATLIKHDIPPYEFIEDVARTCYKSERFKKPGSAEKMVMALVKSKHLAMLEHEFICMRISPMLYEEFDHIELKYKKYMNFLHDYNYYVSSSYRGWIEFVENIIDYIQRNKNSMLSSIVNTLHQYDPNIFTHYIDNASSEVVKIISREEVNEIVDAIQLPIPNSMLSHTIRFITSRSIANELVRHRTGSYAQESQRYVDYGGVEFIKPMIETNTSAYNDWHYAMLMAETQYRNLRDQGIAPQIARGVLPNDCKTEIVVTATEDEWQHIVNLRYHGTTGAPHPQMKELIGMALPLLNKESKGRIK